MRSGTTGTVGDCDGTPLLIVGASARAAAQWARRRGRRPLALDLFGDVDLLECTSDSLRLPAACYPEGLPALARRLPPAPFIATGGLENHLEVMRALEAERPNEFTGSAACAAVRDPARLADVLETAGIPFPPVSSTPPLRGHWLEKKLRSAGGSGIRVASLQPEQALESGDHYFQHFVAGVPCAAVFEVIAGHARLLGISRQLIGESWLNAAEFAYCGSVAPYFVTERAAEVFQQIGSVLTSAFGLRGVFGVDAVIEAEQGLPHVVEVNPRYPASLDALDLREEFDAPVFGKAVLFAANDRRIPAEPLRDLLRAVVEPFHVADIPHGGEVIRRGAPILTVFAPGDSDADCEARLRSTAGAVFRELQTMITAEAGRPGC